ncbi:MAG TPA: methyl coenzyme M reductase system, component A2 [Methanolinea sp.]|jgi:methyl coenzyme M reductase system subunit A2|nr:MAG: Trehalose/maltose import ATP-binding protein MalK [Methanoregulaceae archaeon PtaB.Bin152]HRU80059.1 methyl coenzyme M reductase system, component A2 [Methanolinea sp.]
MNPPFISVRNLSMEYSGKKVLDNLSFEIYEGETMGIIGRSGAGKSVLIHLLRGVEDPPTAGAIVYHVSMCPHCATVGLQSDAGKPCPRCGATLAKADVDFWKPENEALKKQIMRRTAIMFQRTFALYGDDRVIENVLRALDDVDYGEGAINRAADLLDRVRLSHRMMHIARDLSGGEKQRVVLARQLARDPLLLFADEPTGTLDPQTAAIVHQMLRAASKDSGMGIVITSHFSRVIEDTAARAILLDEGRIEKIGAPGDVISHFLRDYAREEDESPVTIGEDILVARDVAKRYMSADRGLIRAVNGVSFGVRRGEIFGIIGKSGAGKTTLSRIIAGIIEPTAGEMNFLVGDEWIDMTKPGIENRGRAKGYIGLLHQEYDLYPHRTVLDNLTDAIGLEFPKELAVRKAKITLAMAGFSDKVSGDILSKYPDQLSEGERHRVALAQVLIREPRMVILDEPTGTMDPLTKRDVKHSILHARQEMDQTFIVVSHDMDFVRELCDRVAWMRGGKIVAIGTVPEVLRAMPPEEGGISSAGEAPGQVT